MFARVSMQTVVRSGPGEGKRGGAPASVPAAVRGAAVTGNVSRSLSHESKVLGKNPKNNLSAAFPWTQQVFSYEPIAKQI